MNHDPSILRTQRAFTQLLYLADTSKSAAAAEALAKWRPALRRSGKLKEDDLGDLEADATRCRKAYVGPNVAAKLASLGSVAVQQGDRTALDLVQAWISRGANPDVVLDAIHGYQNAPSKTPDPCTPQDLEDTRNALIKAHTAVTVPSLKRRFTPKAYHVLVDTLDNAIAVVDDQIKLHTEEMIEAEYVLIDRLQDHLVETTSRYSDEELSEVVSALSRTKGRSDVGAGTIKNHRHRRKDERRHPAKSLREIRAWLGVVIPIESPAHRRRRKAAD